MCDPHQVRFADQVRRIEIPESQLASAHVLWYTTEEIDAMEFEASSSNEFDFDDEMTMTTTTGTAATVSAESSPASPPRKERQRELRAGSSKDCRRNGGGGRPQRSNAIEILDIPISPSTASTSDRQRRERTQRRTTRPQRSNTLAAIETRHDLFADR